jgi:predicted methyltransferase
LFNILIYFNFFHEDWGIAAGFSPYYKGRAMARRGRRSFLSMTRSHAAALAVLALACAAPAAEAAQPSPGPLAPAGAPAAAFPAPSRAVAHIVSPSWGDLAERDRSGEISEIVARLHLKPGMTVADIGAGSGYDTLRLARVVGPGGRVIAEDVTPDYLQALAARVRTEKIANVTLDLGEAQDARLPPASVDAAILVHMYHEISQPYVLLYNLAAAMKPGGRVGVEELDRPTGAHGTPPALLTCEFQAVGYRLDALKPLPGRLGYFAVFTPPAPSQRPAPASIRPCG